MGVSLDDLGSSPENEDLQDQVVEATAPTPAPVDQPVPPVQPNPEPAARATETNQYKKEMDMSQETQFQQSAVTDIFSQLANTSSPLGSRAAEYGHRFKMAWSDAVKESIGKDTVEGYSLNIVSGISVGSPADIATLSYIGGGKNSPIFTYALLLGGAAVVLAPKTEQREGETVSVTQTIGSVYDVDTSTGIQNVLGQILGVPAQSIAIVGKSLVPKNFEITSLTMRDVVANAFMAVSVIAKMASTQSFNVSQLSTATNPNIRVGAKADFSGLQTKDIYGRPLRTEVTLETYAAIKGKSKSWEQQINLTRVQGFINVLYLPQQQVAGMLPSAQVLMPELVITNVSADFGDPTVERILFALVGALSIERDGLWAKAFIPRNNVKGRIDTRDIGAVGCDIKLGQDIPLAKIDTKSASFTQDKLKELLSTVFRRDAGIAISIDLDPTAYNAWLTDLFARSAAGEAASQEVILRAVDRMCNGKFRSRWDALTVQGEKRIMINRGWVQKGTYIHDDGTPHSLDELNDYLAVCNMFGSGDPQVLRDYVETIESPDMPMQLRLSRRERLFRSINDTVNIESYAMRAMFTPYFMQCFVAALAECKVIINPDSSGFTLTGGLRGDASLQGMGMTGFSSSLFQSQTFGGGNWGSNMGGSWGNNNWG